MRLNRRFNGVIMNNLTKLKQRAARICISSRIIPDHQNDPIILRPKDNSALVQCDLFPFDEESLSLEIEIKKNSVAVRNTTAKAFKFLLTLQKYQRKQSVIGMCISCIYIFSSRRKTESTISMIAKKLTLNSKPVPFLENLRDALFCIFSHTRLERFEMRDVYSHPEIRARFSDEQLSVIEQSILEQSTKSRNLTETCIVMHFSSGINADIIRAIGPYRAEFHVPWSLLNSSDLNLLFKLPTASARSTTIKSVIEYLLPPGGITTILKEWLNGKRKINELRLEFETRLNACLAIDVFVVNFPGIQEKMRNETGVEASLIRPSDGKLMKISMAPGFY